MAETKQSAKESVRQLQTEYDKLAADGANFGKKSAGLEKTLRAEMGEKLKAAGLDRADLIARKGDVFKRLRAAKEQRRKDIVAGVVNGSVAPEAGEAEIVSMGWELAVARNDIQSAQIAKANPIPQPQHIETAAPTQKIVDPITDGRPASREEKFEDPQKHTKK